jgi:hypothetical protein
MNYERQVNCRLPHHKIITYIQIIFSRRSVSLDRNGITIHHNFARRPEQGAVIFQGLAVIPPPQVPLVIYEMVKLNKISLR